MMLTFNTLLGWLNISVWSVLFWWLSFLLSNLSYLIYLSFIMNLNMEMILYFYMQEVLGFLFLLAPSLCWATSIVLFKGGFGPYFLWLMIVVNSLNGMGLVHFLGSVKLPYYGVLLGLETISNTTLLLGVFLSANLLFLLNRASVILFFLSSAESGNLMLLNNKSELVCLLVLVYTSSLMMTVSPSANPSEVAEGTLNFVSVPMTTAFSLKLTILGSFGYSPTSLLLILSLWVSIMGGSCFILTTMMTPNKMLKSHKGWTNGLVLFMLILLL